MVDPGNIKEKINRRMLFESEYRGIYVGYDDGNSGFKFEKAVMVTNGFGSDTPGCPIDSKATQLLRLNSCNPSPPRSRSPIALERGGMVEVSQMFLGFDDKSLSRLTHHL